MGERCSIDSGVSREDNYFRRYDTLSYLREEISWKVTVRVNSMEDRSRKKKRTEASALRKVVN